MLNMPLIHSFIARGNICSILSIWSYSVCAGKYKAFHLWHWNWETGEVTSECQSQLLDIPYNALPHITCTKCEPWTKQLHVFRVTDQVVHFGDDRSSRILNTEQSMWCSLIRPLSTPRLFSHITGEKTISDIWIRMINKCHLSSSSGIRLPIIRGRI